LEEGSGVAAVSGVGTVVGLVFAGTLIANPSAGLWFLNLLAEAQPQLYYPLAGLGTIAALWICAMVVREQN